MTETTYDIIENPEASSDLWKKWKHLVDTEGWTSDDNSVTALTPSLKSTRSVWAVSKTPDRDFVGCVIWNEYDKLAFLGFFILAPEFRGQGIGSVIWDVAISRIPHDYVLGLRGVPSMVEKYRAKATPVVGARLENYRMKVAEYYASMESSTGDHYKLVNDLNPEEWKKLVQYDKDVNGRSRQEFLDLYYKLDFTLGVVIFDGNHNVIAHISAVSTSHKEDNVFKIAPLYADSPNIAMSALRVFSRVIYEKHPNADVIFHVLDIGSGSFLQSFFRSLEIVPAVENGKSPESSDCEGYATPLASSLTDLSSHGITISLPEDSEDRPLASGELTPKPKILVMTQREIDDEECGVRRSLEEDSSSEEEFYDVADVQIRIVAEQLLNAVSEERVATPIMQETESDDAAECSADDEVSGSVTPVFPDDEVSDELQKDVVECIGSLLTEVEGTQASQPVCEPEEREEVFVATAAASEQVNLIGASTHESEEESAEEVIEAASIGNLENQVSIDSRTELSSRDGYSEKESEDIDLTDETAPTVELTNSVALTSERQLEDHEQTVFEMAPTTAEALPDEVEVSSKSFIPEKIAFDSHVCDLQSNDKTETEMDNANAEDESIPVIVLKDEAVSIQEEVSSVLIEPESQLNGVSQLEELVEAPEEIIPVEAVPKVPEPEEKEVLATLPINQETIAVNEPMPIVVISDEVKTHPATTEGDVSDCSPHEVKVDFDVDGNGYSSGKEESLSSSTSSESFEFAEPALSPASDEKALALRNSIIERYPSNDTDDDDLDSGGEDFDDDLLAVKQISAEVEQLVAAINAFGRDEEQQMSAYLVGKKMAAEKKRKMDAAVSVSTFSSCHDQLVQTDNDSFILVDRHLPQAMDSLQVEIDRLQADLNKVRSGEKELLKINAKLQEELEESQQTIDGIEVEAEQQYTELTSEIDELCEIVMKKDQELASLKEKVANLSVSESNLKDDVDSQRVIVQRQKEIVESLREELDAITKKLGEVTKLRDKAIEEATLYKMKNMERDRFLSKEAQMSMEIEDLQRELNKQKLILNQTSMAKLADTFDRKVLHLENELRERDMLICKQNQIINSHRKSPTGSVITQRKMQPRASVLAAAGNLPSAGSSSESFQNGLDIEAREALLSFILSDRHNQLANIYNIGRILDLTPQEERAVERHLTKDRFT
ncbi:unnamed protein product [Caenorhabditis sp. 36 PRJEB53466]|nr:unnamed protein product [Caenorhabditis sp. 36 PRJEB53466]